MNVTNVRLRPEIESALEAMAEKLHLSKGVIVNQAIQEFVERQELAQSRWSETQIAMESVAAGKIVSGDAVHTWLTSWGSANELPPPQTGR